MGSVLSSESITVDQLNALLGDLKAKDAKVTIHVSAFHYEQYTETTIENEEIPPEGGPLNGRREAAPEESKLQWVRGSDGSHPEGAVKAGTDHGVPIFVARARHQGGLVPGKLHHGHKAVYVPWGGVEHAKKGYEVLTGTGLSWTGAANGHVPKNAVKGGHTADGQPLYVIRAKVEGIDACGKINPQNQFGHVPFGGKEHIVKHYEVLVQHCNQRPPLAAPPAPPRFRQKVRTEVKQKKVETFRTEHHIPLSYCIDLTGPTLEGWKPTVQQPVVIVKLNLEVFPLDRESSEQLEQYKRHLASQYANKDKILETKVKFSVKGKTLEAGRDPITITAYDPKFVDVANSGFCCFGRPGVKREKVTVIKKFFMAPLHISGEGNSLVPPSVNGHPSVGFPQQQPSAPAPQYPPMPQYSQAPQYTQASQYPPTSQYPPLTPADANQNWSQPPYLLS